MSSNSFNAYNNQAYDNMEDIPLPVYSETYVQPVLKEVNDTGFNSSSRSHISTTEIVTPRHVVSSQPRTTSEQINFSFTGTRRPIPVSVIGRDDISTNIYSPTNGLDFLRNVDQLIIQEHCDIANITSNKENRYTVKIPARENAEPVYYATECSKPCQRLFFGSSRAFNMRLYDTTDQEAMSFKRRLACGYCTFCFNLQRMEVWVPPGELVGTISQQWKPLLTSFEVRNRHEQVLYIIEGPQTFSCFHNAQIFQIYTSDGSTQIGNIVHQWDPVAADHQLRLNMPRSITDNRHKALLLGSAFLVEYMFFENAQKKISLKCFC